MVEDATDIILNLKQIPFKMHTSEPKTLRVLALEPGVLKSGDIEPDADVEVLDPNVHLATVSEGGNLNIEMRLKKGRGYVPADRNFDDDLPVGYIPVDSVHSPVKKVNFHVEAARLGQDTDYDKLTLEVWTNGSVSPERAIGLAAKLIKDHMQIFINFEEDVQEPAESGPSRSAPTFNENLDRSVDELELSVRAYNCLKNSDIKTIRDLVQKSEGEMLKTKNFGRKSLNEIKDILTSMGLGLGMKLDDQGKPDTGRAGTGSECSSPSAPGKRTYETSCRTSEIGPHLVAPPRAAAQLVHLVRPSRAHRDDASEGERAAAVCRACRDAWSAGACRARAGKAKQRFTRRGSPPATSLPAIRAPKQDSTPGLPSARPVWPRSRS